MNDYRANGITTAMHFPVTNYDGDYKEKVFTAAQYLHKLVDMQSKKVFIHCSSGLIRTPTIVLTYLTIFKRVKSWKSVSQTRDVVCECCGQHKPQENIVEQIIAANRSFQDQQVDIHTEKDRRRQEIIRKYDQKDRILRELQYEKEERQRKEIERQRMLAQRR